MGEAHKLASEYNAQFIIAHYLHYMHDIGPRLGLQYYWLARFIFLYFWVPVEARYSRLEGEGRDASRFGSGGRDWAGGDIQQAGGKQRSGR